MNPPPSPAHTSLLTDVSRQLLCAAVTRFSGVRLAESADNMIGNRLLKFMAARGLVDAEALVRQVCANPSTPLAHELFGALLNNETSFFRDPAMYAQLRERVFPALFSAQADQRRLDVWCAACSTGQEAYSVAMLLASMFPAEFRSWTINILATDVSEANLARARAGVYTKLEVNRGLPAPMLAAWTHKTELGWQIAAPLRERVQFALLNLIEPWPSLPRFDLILLRNVMIYWDPGLRLELLARVAGTIAPHGALVLGGAELLASEAPFQLDLQGRWPTYHPIR